MRREDKKKITLKRRLIVNNMLDLEGVLDYLISKQVFTLAIRERIIYESRVPRDRIRHMLDYLVTRGPNSFKTFLEALILTGNGNIAQELEPEYVKSDECRILVQSEEKFSVETTTNNINQNYLQIENCFASPNNYASETFIKKSILSPCSKKFEEESSSKFVSKTTLTPTQFINLRHKSPSPVRLMRPSVTNTCSPHYSGYQPSSLSINTQTKFPVTVASCQFSTKTSSNEALSFDNELNSNVNYTNDDTFLILGQDSLVPQDITWNDINNLGLDFEVFTSNENFDSADEHKHNEEIYPMENNPRGVCLIINNEHFYDNEYNELPALRRYGTDMDASRLKILFEKLKFEVQLEYDLNQKELKQIIQKFSRDCEINSNYYEASCLIILSHGTDGYINGIDYENKINIDRDVLNLFDNVLYKKPKLFIFQACRGENFNQKLISKYSIQDTINKFQEMQMNQQNISSNLSVNPSTSCNNLKELNKKPINKSHKITSFTDGRPIKTNLPSRSDFFIWYSSVRGFVSHRDSDGSPFIKCLVSVFSRYSKSLELIEMVRRVNSLMQQYEQIHFDEQNSVLSYFMLPVTEYHLTKKLYFNP